MQIVNKSTAKLKPYDKNAKKHDKKQIANVAESIKQFGFVQPIVLDKGNNVIIGHCRLEAAKKLHLDEVPCVMADDLTDEQVKKLRLLDNKLNESDWDIDLIAEEIADLDFDGFDVNFESKKKKEEIEGDVPFTEELLEEHNYMVLYFDNEMDWQQAVTVFGIGRVKLNDKGKFKSERKGVGRVLNGAEAINRLLGE